MQRYRLALKPPSQAAVIHRSLHAAHDPLCSRDTRISTSPEPRRDACREARPREYGVDISHSDASVLSGNVAAAQRGEEVAVVVEHPCALRLPPGSGTVGINIGVRRGDDTLATAPPEPSEGRFPPHACGEPQAIADVLFDRAIVAEPDTPTPLATRGAPKKGPEDRVVWHGLHKWETLRL